MATAVPPHPALPRDVALAPVHGSRRVRCLTASAARPAALVGLGSVSALAMFLIVIGLNAPLVALVATGAVGYGMLLAAGARHVAATERTLWPFARPIEPEVAPEAIGAAELRVQYEALLRTHEDMRRAILASQRLHGCLRDLFARCGELVQLAGRLARAANPLCRYLDDHARDRLMADLGRLSAAANASPDELAAHSYRQALAGRVRQLDTFVEIQGMRDRIRARLEVVAATLQSIEVLVVKLRSIDFEQGALPGESIAEHLRSVDEEISDLGAAMDEAFREAG